jgi:glycosyltransferase involved in cell wall biosynthesis
MVQRGHEVRVIDYPITWKENIGKSIINKRMVNGSSFKVISPGVTVIRPPIIRFPILCYSSLIVTHRREIVRQLQEFRPDIVVGFGLLNARIALEESKKHGIKFVYYILDELHRLVPERVLQPIAKLVEMHNYSAASQVISINQGLKEYTEEMGADKSKTIVIPAGVDFERFANADGSDIRKRYGFSNNDVILFFMGWLYDFSGLDIVARALANCENKHIKMLILGKGDLWDDLNNIKQEFKLNDRLILEDWKPYDEIPMYLAASDICLLPARQSKVMTNIVPIKLYEYLASGKAVFATDFPGIRKEFGEGNGVIYIDKPDDAIELACQLTAIHALTTEGGKGQNHVRENDWSTMTDLFEKTLESLIESDAVQ